MKDFYLLLIYKRPFRCFENVYAVGDPFICNLNILLQREFF